MRRRLIALTLSLAVLGGLAACAAPDAAPLGEDAVVIDVRTPAEFASGHLEGAVNIDVQSAEFDARIAELDPDGEYYVYCRSGNRAGQAIDRMTDQGVDDLRNGGGLDSAAAETGLGIVTE